MDELVRILRVHALRYPQMEPTDAVKLIYQNEFGGGHLIRDQESCLAYLQAEYDRTPYDAAVPLFEDIGNGIVRVHLAALSEDLVAQLGRAFIRSAQSQQGSVERFRRKLDVLRSLCAAGQFSFDLQTLDAYLLGYEEAGYPVVSHSQAYRAAYQPAYRIVKKDEFPL